MNTHIWADTTEAGRTDPEESLGEIRGLGVSHLRCEYRSGTVLVIHMVS